MSELSHLARSGALCDGVWRSARLSGAGFDVIPDFTLIALGIAAESPQRSEDLERKARPGAKWKGTPYPDMDCQVIVK